ncbi:MAG TPA: chromosome segregation protein ScpA [Candidatus Methanomethylophilaceae archaeon]|nr:chromosome segregation protein ScpA [Candidatus Methanomethylophilaceae archaeon]
MDGTTRYEKMEQHLLFHKALTDNAESSERISGYMDILQRTEGGELLEDPIDESIRSVFSLVIENGIDPWEIDLSEFVKIYSNKVSENKFDMIVAGKLILMAWKVLRLQSDATRDKSEPPEPEFEVPDDFFFEEENGMFVPQVAFKEAFAREPTRRVTMYELIDAFEEARNEIAVQKERDRVKIAIKNKEPQKFENKAHEEDDEKDVQEIWRSIEKLGTGEILIKDLYNSNIMHNLTVFVSVLHLVRNGKLEVRQENMPHSEIFIEMLIDGAIGNDGGKALVEAV